VRVHADEKAAQSAGAVNALAYTVGRDVVFGAGQYRLETDQGKWLLAHELTHVAQQNAHPANPPASIGVVSDDKLESEAAATRSADPTGHPSVLHRSDVLPLQRQAAGRGGVVQAHRFTSEGVDVVVRASCAPAAFGFANVEAATHTALDAIFNTECIEESRRTRIQRNLTAHGLDIRCRRSANLETPGACAESTGFFIPANIFTLGSKSFAGHPDSSAGCQPMEATILHEIVHLTRGFAQESLPGSCEASCFGVGGGDPTLCRDIDVFGKRHVP
jgi:hypothetical protein